jgi:hypothetical protein
MNAQSPDFKLKPRWCSCKPKEPVEETIFKDDGECKCGINKHHYHCVKCGKVNQIG